MSASGRVELPSDPLAAARDHFARAAAAGELPEAFEGLAEAAWYLSDEAQVFDGRERASL